MKFSFDTWTQEVTFKITVKMQNKTCYNYHRIATVD